MPIATKRRTDNNSNQTQESHDSVNAGRPKAGQPETGKRLTISLGPTAVAVLDSISDGGTKSYSDLIRDAIWLDGKITHLLADGGELYFRPKGGEFQMLILR